ncbi:MAG: hypothetical protein HC815_27905 [Richelia sp. RM1_1_1]|nr:hypothetical protein [Richelia sp. SM1_7_0]NJN11592.1 hypothetical protein [Richelia sp. RM1_1_1]
MSNHSGSRMLNDIIQLLNDQEVLNTIGLQKSQQVITQIVDIASRIYDCNPGEILDGHTDYLNLCHCCLLIATDLDNGLCYSCRS